MVSAKTQLVNEENVTKDSFVIPSSLDSVQPIDITGNINITNLSIGKTKENSQYGIIEESSSRLDTTSPDIERYNHQDHYHLIEEWSAYWNYPICPKELFFDLGYVVDNTAIAFLVLTNSKQAFIEHLIASPFVDTVTRDTVLTKLFDRMESDARDLGYKAIGGLINLPTISERSLLRDYTPQGTYSYYMKLLSPLNQEF